MSRLGPRLLKGSLVRSSRVTRVFLVAASAALLVGVSLFATVGDASSPQAHTAKAPAYVSACDQKTGPSESIGDLNVRTHTACAKGQKAFKLALYPAARGPAGPRGPPVPRALRGRKVRAAVAVRPLSMQSPMCLSVEAVPRRWSGRRSRRRSARRSGPRPVDRFASHARLPRPLARSRLQPPFCHAGVVRRTSFPGC